MSALGSDDSRSMRERSSALALCVVCEDLGCEHCPGVTAMALVQEALDRLPDPDAFEGHLAWDILEGVENPDEATLQRVFVAVYREQIRQGGWIT